jgi:hypothetical protein
MTSRPWLVAVAKLTALLGCVSLATSRIGLVVHELVGHGGAAIACGGQVTDVTLFWFAGGWVQSSYPPTHAAVVTVMLGGIAIELAAGVALWLALARRSRASFGARCVRAVGATLVVHALCYLAAGTYHGFGDGIVLYHELGDGRLPVALVAGALACGAAYAGARSIVRALLATLPGRRIAGLALAVALAGGLQVALAVGEVQLRRDAVYARIMKPERDRLAERELAEWLRRHHDASAAEREAELRALAARHREFPFAIVLGICVAAAVVAGAVRSRAPAEPPAITGRLLARAIAVALASLAAVIAIDLAFH